jgi:hypothetical protein
MKMMRDRDKIVREQGERVACVYDAVAEEIGAKPMGSSP